MFGTKPYHFCLDFFFPLGFGPLLLQVALTPLAAISSYVILVPACASELGNRAAALFKAIAENSEFYIFKLQSVFQ